MTIDDMESVLDRLGVVYVGDRGNEIQGYCPAHEQRTGHADRNPSWYINADTGAHICFSCEYRGNLVSLVALQQSLTYDDAKEWLSKGADLSEAFERAITKPTETFEELVHISEATLAAFSTPPAGALKSRGILPQVAVKYQLLWDSRKECWVIPQRSCETGELLGWQEKGYTTRYFKNYPPGVKKSDSLFGFQQYSGGDMIVVESPLDVARLASVGVLGGVAIYGAVISDTQLSNIRTADRIILALDNDEAGGTASKKMLQNAISKGFEVWFFDYSHTTAKDVGGMTAQEIHQGIEKAQHLVRFNVRQGSQ